jgi:hypothetical protein
MRRVLISVGLTALLMLTAGILYLHWTRSDKSSAPPIMGVGSVRDALQWRRRFLTLPDPETATNAFPEIVSKRFPDDSWIFGICTDSHASPEGGTIVLKDSTGKIRVFFGHVCGAQYLKCVLLTAASLDEVYQELQFGKVAGFRFGEYLLLPED